MDQSTANDYIEDLLEERAQLLEEIGNLKQELLRVSLAYLDKVMDDNHHVVDRVHE